MELLLKYNAELKDCVKNLLAQSASKKLTKSCPTVNENSKSNLLVRKLMRISDKQSQAESCGNRYDCTVKKFASYIFMIGGRLSYETLCANLPLPSPSSVSRYLLENGPDIIEGQLRLQELKNYLIKADLPLVIWVSEDATRITGTVQYDPKTNQLIGLVLPTDKNGMPKCKSFMATSPKVMEETMQNIPIASLAYTIMAQPLQKNAASFCLCIFGTDNKFTAEHVLNRFQFIYEQCQQFGIRVLGFSSDGDPRLLKAMRIESQIGISNLDLLFGKENWTWFNSEFCSEYFVCQDTVHIGTKLRNRFIKNSIVLPMGNNIATVSHLKLLIQSQSKDKHQITYSDLDPKDKMNFPSVQKICQENVRKLLNDTVPGSEGTCQYLKILHNTVVSYIDSELTPLERIFSIWYSVFCLRMWRAWISANDSYTLGKNFITSNCYTCIEINAHTLIDVIIRLRDSDQPELFLPSLYSSQPCESFFRQVRSMSSTYSTIVNCSMMDIIHRLNRIQVQNEIIIEESENIIFPRFRERKSVINVNTYPLPSNQEIQKTVEDAKCRAIEDLGNLGIFFNNILCTLPFSAKSIQLDSDDESDSEEISEETESANEDTISAELEHDMITLQSVTGTLELKNYSTQTVQLNETSPFAVVRDSSQAEYVVRKSSICWLLNKTKHRLSSDRLQRVREIELPHLSKKESATRSNTVEENPEISIGTWMLFREDTEAETKYRVGLVLGFVYLTGKTDPQREYSRLSADVNNESIGVLCTWYRLISSSLRPAPVGSHDYKCISGYMRTLPTPQIVDGHIFYSDLVLKLILEIIPTTSLQGKDANIGNFVLIEFLTKKTKKYYIGVVKSIQSRDRDCEEDYEVKFMRKVTNSSSSIFVFPDVDDTSYVTGDQIKLILSNPKIDRRRHHVFSDSDLLEYAVI
ncbi:uncharacterized protein [Neodiprion pinetum]|uniref:Uncharacterized protein LOC124293074 isoform X1 n=2 Tax=Neodiprion lecontei TaxID=441921 RepID=A0ABM3FQ41_NEOLC|nr:uncharacterized protein LOC124174365 isoform X1 [Neodiprion fabricii]XP_046409391.1 uncharacterized protein LOC124174365 isoform X1 [Neodiprion fabricii]XP_046411758.1 uncharacterized protein LOC124175484 [Neodiprion fabricii]XP_046415343.1 uncharacterized protein LOC124177208 isoform X1 [Neodiprion fabricii]XP_046415424.1 uncharacterized protein LOC124177208 isoform X1 [Neodiprion fabricii]XP_046418205.1 uncharacterized protein LOC124178693 isoform X1 [Neodiprion fabricii]XP_046418206.1 u